MANKSFVLLSLKEDKIKEMTQVLNNDTCRKILEYLSNNEIATATEISKALGLAMSTVHYNLKQLVNNDLVTSNDYHYSDKGKEVIHYGLANKYIIIAPKEDKNILEKLKGFLPITMISAFTGALIYLIETNWEKLSGIFFKQEPAMLMARTANDVEEVLIMEMDTLVEPAMAVMETTAAEPTTGMLIAPWFFAGATFAILIMIAYEFSKKNKK